MGLADELDQLRKLKEQGVLTDAEFEEQKRRLLAGPGGNARPNVTLSAPQPANHLVEAILVTLFCCLPFGIVSIVKASQVQGLYAGGDYDGSLAASEAAKKWALWGSISGFILIAIYALLVARMGFHV
jgi:hypothetical protein